jgi:serine protease Do
VVRGYLGLETEAVSAELRAQLRLGEDQGVLVRSVQPGSPAAQGGIEQWDVILEFGQQKVPSPIMFKRLVDRARPGEKVSVGVIRAGRRKLVEVAIGESSAGVAAQNKMNLATPGRRLPPTPWLGVKVAPVSPSLRRQLGIEASLTIEVVLQNSPAEKAGLQKWDVLLEFAGEKVQSEEQLRRQVEHTTPAQRVPVVILRGGQQQTLTVEMAAQYISRWAPGYL